MLWRALHTPLPPCLLPPPSLGALSSVLIPVSAPAVRILGGLLPPAVDPSVDAPPPNTIRAHAKADRDLTSAGEAPGCCGTSTRGEQQKGRERGECGTAANVLQEPGRSSPHATEVGRVEKLCLHKENEANFEPGRQAELSRPAKANPGASSLARDSLTTRWGITCSWSNR